MSVTLRVISFHSQALGAQATRTFGPEGGTIGRVKREPAEHHWILPDPERFVSSYHAKIECRNGSYILKDPSVNGTFVNSSGVPIGGAGEHVLRHGDRITIGEYEIEVELGGAPAGATGPGASGIYGAPPSGPPTGGGLLDPTGSQRMGAVDPLAAFPDVPAAPAARPPTAPDHDSIFDDFADLSPVQRPASPTAPGMSAGQTGREVGINYIPDDEDWDKTGFNPPDRSASGSQWPQQPVPPPPAAPPPQMPPQAAPPPAGYGAETYAPGPTGAAGEGMAAVLQAAGMDAASARAVAGSPQLAGVLGMMLRVTVEGMLEVLKARSQIKGQFRVPMTMMQSTENNPLKFSVSVVDALTHLLQAPSAAYLGPVEALSEGFQDIKAHQVAVIAGMRAAFDSMLKRFDPEVLVSVFEKRLKRGSLLQMPGKGRYWEMYRDIYEEWTEDADRNFQRLFGEEFGRAYEEQMMRMASRRR